MSVRIAQIGVGHWGKNLARNFAEIGVLAAVSDNHPETAGRVAAEHDVPARGLSEVIADPSIDAVAIATPAATHADVALQAIAAGKHVYVEKPLALLPEDAERMIAAADAAGRVLMVGHLLQYHPIFLALKQLVADGELGELRYIYSNRLSAGKLRTEEDVLWSFAPHDLSMILSLADEEPVTVSAASASWVTPGIDDWTIAHMRFPSGVAAHVHATWMHPFKEQRLVVAGSKATAVFEDSIADWNKRLAHYPTAIDRSGAAPVLKKSDARYIEVGNGEPLRAECQHFVDCITSGGTPRTDGNEGLRVLRTLARIDTALATGAKGAGM